MTVPPGPFSADAFFDEFAAAWAARGLPLYRHQEDAILELLLERHVVLSTPTGSGKSLVALAAHDAALRQGRTSWYTAPIKALVAEKYDALVSAFGAERVGMITGERRVNPEAPLICATAEILANRALRRGANAGVDEVVMDEFHYFGDPDRGWAWQVPLLQLSRTRFLLMSATLGDTTEITRDLAVRTGRDVAEVTGVVRPVPLEFQYRLEAAQELVEALVNDALTPAYLVHFSQAAAVERAAALVNAKIASRAERDRIAEAIAGFPFRAGFGQTLSRLLRAGVGVHHAGMLPKYRRLVESLAQRGLLRVICGTDTLGVGINVPIRTVVFTSLVKFDGNRTRRLSAREFHQIAGRAGRAGFDAQGTVVVQAPEHEIDNAKASAKAAADPKRAKRTAKKSAPPGVVGWSEATLDKLRDAEPEPLHSSMRLTVSMLVNLIARGSDGGAGVFADVRSLVYDNHEPPAAQAALARRALALYRTLRTAGLVEQEGGGLGPGARIRMTVELQPDFALNQPLSPFAVALIEALDPDEDGYALDVVSIVEATLDDPAQVLAAQQHRARGEAVAAMKADGVEYEERMALLEEVSWPKPLEGLIREGYEVYSRSQPWALDFEPSPKAVVRELWERAMGFADFVRHYGLARSEGVLLRYLADAARALRQTVPESAKTEQLRELSGWLEELVAQIDETEAAEFGLGEPRAARSANDSLLVRPAFTVMVRNAMWRRVDLAARQRDDELVALDPDAGWPGALDAYFAEHDEIGTGPDARSAAKLSIERGETEWRLRQTIDDPAGDGDWVIEGVLDVAASEEAGEPVIRVAGLRRLDQMSSNSTPSAR